jgi:hypothetical protein
MGYLICVCRKCDKQFKGEDAKEKCKKHVDEKHPNFGPATCECHEI